MSYGFFQSGEFLQQCENPESMFNQALRILGRNPGLLVTPE